jgi:hypothetical protein
VDIIRILTTHRIRERSAIVAVSRGVRRVLNVARFSTHRARVASCLFGLCTRTPPTAGPVGSTRHLEYVRASHASELLTAISFAE